MAWPEGDDDVHRLAEAAAARADATDDDSEDEPFTASESEGAKGRDPWTDDGEYVVCLGCPEEDDGLGSSGEDVPSDASDDDGDGDDDDDDDGPPEETTTKRKREDEAEGDDGDE